LSSRGDGRAAETSLSSWTAATDAAAEQAARLVGAVSMICALRGNPKLRELLRAAAGVEVNDSILVEKAGASTCLLLDSNSLVVALREKPAGLPSVNLMDLISESGPRSEALSAALKAGSVSKLADTVVHALYASALPDRETMGKVLEWAPVIEHEAYGAGTAVVALLDEMRPQVLAALATPHDTSIFRYWRLAHTLANLTMLAADRGARPWLSHMADQFVWADWTPTFALVRERSVWLAACAARSAATFGEPVVEKYLSALRNARHPVRAFDALFGLTAIGIAESSATKSIRGELHSLRKAIDEGTSFKGDHIRAAYDDAMATLAGARAHEQTAVLESVGLKWRSKSAHGLATRGALRRDPLRFYTGGRALGFAILRTVFETAPKDFYPLVNIEETQRLGTPRDAVRAVQQAWSAAALRVAPKLPSEGAGPPYMLWRGSLSRASRG